MNRSVLYSMQDRLAPDEQVVERLKERIAAGETARKSPAPRWYAAAAVCAALALLAVPVARGLRPAPVRLHSVVTGSGSETFATVTTTGGTSQEEAGEKETPVTEDTGAVNTGDLPGGAYVGEPEPVPGMIPAEGDQEAAVNAYGNLTARFEADYGYDSWPDWYGGAYLQNGMLIVCVVNDNVPGEYLIDAGGDKIPGKEFYLQIQEWAGDGERTDAVGFADVKYSLRSLRELQEKITALPELKGLDSWGCGVDEMQNLVELTVPQADRELLAALAELDPEDDAVLVLAGVETTALTLDE